MFIYDGIRSQLEWNSTLSPAKAIHPTAETKYLRKVWHLPSSFQPTQDSHNIQTAIIATIGAYSDPVVRSGC